MRMSDHGAKKLHEITAEGRAFLDANPRAVDALLARMAEVSRTHGGGPAPQIIRALENLKLALRLRLSQGPLSDDQIDAVATMIDAAATGVDPRSIRHPRRRRNQNGHLLH
jgi:hypothetical protein